LQIVKGFLAGSRLVNFSSNTFLILSIEFRVLIL
jgi:hypothetical protein